MPNPTPGENRVVSTAVLALDQLSKQFTEVFSNLSLVYSDSLDYRDAVTLHRRRNMERDINESFFPAMAFNRSPLRHTAHGIGRRMSTISITNRLASPNTVNTYGAIHGEFDVNFSFLTREMSDFEQFEILYLSERGISSRKQLTVDLSGEFGEGTEFTYYANYGLLEEKVFEHEGNHYKALNGKVVVSGVFPLFLTTDDVITSIRSRILDFENQVLSTTTIV